MNLGEKLLLVVGLSCAQISVQANVLPILGLFMTAQQSVDQLSLYVTANCLVQEKHLVATKYPHAQMWYDSMAVKYPTAHLDQKQFLQTWRNVDAKYIQHCSLFNQIYFPQISLERINDLYKQVIDGEQLTKEEQIYLGREEFLLLHEAAHIEHSDVLARAGSKIGMSALLTGLAQLYINAGMQDKALACLMNDLEMDENSATITHHYLIFIMAVVLYTQVFVAVANPQEAAADKFACDLADMNALEGGITFFEDSMVDPLINIEDETVSPFIPVKSSIEQMLQSWVSGQDEQALTHLKNTKSNPALRLQYDSQRDPIHPSPSSRAQLIRDEIARRQALQVLA